MNNDQSTNGHASSELAPITRPEKFVVRNYRIHAGDCNFVRMLSDDYLGLFTHYAKRSHLCMGRDCPPSVHRADRVWKGYVAAQVFDKRSDCWYPICFEITENLELDLRGVFKRGQTWEIWRDMPTNKSKPPVQGKLHTEEDPKGIPRPFDIIPCLRALYHTDVIDLSHKSPIPGRVYVEVSQGNAPKALQPKDQDDQTAKVSFVEEFARLQKQKALAKRGPTEAKTS